MALSLKGGTRVRLFRFWLDLTWPSVVNTAKTPSAPRLHFYFWGIFFRGPLASPPL